MPSGSLAFQSGLADKSPKPWGPVNFHGNDKK